MKPTVIAMAITSALLLTHSSERVFAQDSTISREAGNREISLGLGIPSHIDLHGHIGLSVGALPDYEGSGDFSAAAMPLMDIRQQNFIFIRGASVNPNDGAATLGWNALNVNYSQASRQKLHLSAGPLLRYYRGRNDNANDTLDGLGDIGDAVGLGGFIEASAGPWSAAVIVVPQDVGDEDDGTLVTLGAEYTAQIRKRLGISMGVSTSWGDDGYMQGYYGISITQSARSGLEKFDAQSGVKDAGVQIGATYAVSQRFMINGQMGYRRLLNDAADSPIVDGDGSRDQFSALVGMVYQF